MLVVFRFDACCDSVYCSRSELDRFREFLAVINRELRDFLYRNSVRSEIGTLVIVVANGQLYCSVCQVEDPLSVS